MIPNILPLVQSCSAVSFASPIGGAVAGLALIIIIFTTGHRACYFRNHRHLVAIINTHGAGQNSVIYYKKIENNIRSTYLINFLSTALLLINNPLAALLCQIYLMVRICSPRYSEERVVGSYGDITDIGHLDIHYWGVLQGNSAQAPPRVPDALLTDLPQGASIRIMHVFSNNDCKHAGVCANPNILNFTLTSCYAISGGASHPGIVKTFEDNPLTETALDIDFKNGTNTQLADTVRASVGRWLNEARNSHPNSLKLQYRHILNQVYGDDGRVACEHIQRINFILQTKEQSPLYGKVKVLLFSSEG